MTGVRFHVELDQFTSSVIAIEAYRTHRLPELVIRDMVVERMGGQVKPTLDTQRVRAELLIRLGWHDVWVADTLGASLRYVQQLRRDADLLPPIKTPESPATYTQPVRKGTP